MIKLSRERGSERYEVCDGVAALRSYDSCASGDQKCSHRQGCMANMAKQSRTIEAGCIQQRLVIVCHLIGCSPHSKSDTMHRQLVCRCMHVALNHLLFFRKEVFVLMEKLITRKEAAKILGISITTLDAARSNGLISYVQYVENGCVYFTSAGLEEYIAKCTHRAKPMEKSTTYRKTRGTTP